MLSIKNLDFYYNDDNKLIVNNFSYTFKGGLIYWLFWKSWLWKSTLARIISWFLKPIAGNIRLDKEFIKKPSKEIIYISQKDDIFYRLSIYENLYLLCHNKKKVEVALEKINMIEFKNSYPKTLSWWMLKRLSFARVLLIQPKVLILDEPFVYLDWKTKDNLISLLIDIKTQNPQMIIILISHSKKEMKIADKVLYFQDDINNAFSH